MPDVLYIYKSIGYRTLWSHRAFCSHENKSWVEQIWELPVDHYFTSNIFMDVYAWTKLHYFLRLGLVICTVVKPSCNKLYLSSPGDSYLVSEGRRWTWVRKQNLTCWEHCLFLLVSRWLSTTSVVSSRVNVVTWYKRCCPLLENVWSLRSASSLERTHWVRRSTLTGPRGLTVGEWRQSSSHSTYIHFEKAVSWLACAMIFGCQTTVSVFPSPDTSGTDTEGTNHRKGRDTNAWSSRAVVQD